MATMPAASRLSALPRSATGSARAAGETALGANLAKLASFPFDAAFGDGGEHVLERRHPVALEQLARRPELDQPAMVEDRHVVAVTFGLLHHVRGHHERGAGLLAQRVEPLPDQVASGRGQA